MGPLSRASDVSHSQPPRRVYRLWRSRNERATAAQILELARLAHFFQERYPLRFGYGKGCDSVENLAIIVEGYTDVVVAHQEGFKNVVASLGTALTEKQLSQLSRMTKRYALALDADEAGAAATERGLKFGAAGIVVQECARSGGSGFDCL